MTSPSRTENPSGVADDVDEPRSRSLAPFATGPVLGIAAVAATSMLAFATRYGYHRDELYFIAGGRRLDTGYVDHPPLTPLLARAADVAFGQSLLGLRALTALLVLAGVVAVALLARELGGGRTAQVLAAFAVAASPLLRGHNAYFGTTGLDQLMWALALVPAARLLRTRDTRYWIAVGAALGLGLETKATIAVLAVALVIGIAAERRWDLLRSWWFLAGVAIAAVLWAPNVVWNASHEWAFVTFSGDKRSSITDVSSDLYFILSTLLMAGITTIFVWYPGWRRLVRSTPRSPFRPLGIAATIVVATFFLLGSKYYYVGPVFLLLFAAGGVALEAGPRPTRVLATWMVALSILLCAPMTMPLLPAADLASVDAFNRDYPSMVGWPELADQVHDVVASLPEDEQANTVVFALNYGEAAALEHFAPDLHVYSGHNSYWFWGPPPDTATTAVIIGYGDTTPTDLCTAPERVGTITNDAGLDNFEAGQPIWLCRDLVRPWSEAWPAQRQYT